MKLSCVLIFLLIGVMTTVNARSEPMCSYIDTKGEEHFLRWWDYNSTGEQYFDSEDGKCTKRATCSNKEFKAMVQDCSEFDVTCGNKATFEGVFPACCVKC